MPAAKGLAPTSEPAATFEVDRIERTGDDRLEIAGRWFGVRGRRFLRPTLEVDVDGRRHRALALLEHKPWAAVDGEEWVAAFEWSRDAAELGNAELAVGADLAVALAAPGKRTRKPRSRPSQAARELEGARAELARTEEKLERARAAHAAQVESAGERVTAEQRANRRLQADLDETRARAAEAGRELEPLRGELASLAGEVGRLRVERDAAATARDAAIDDSGRLERERETAVRAGAAAVARLEGAAGASERIKAELEAVRERLRKASAERDSAPGALDAAREERDAARAERDAETASPRPTEAAPAPLPAPAPPPAEREWTARFVAVAAVVVPLLILALLIAFAA